MKRWCLKYSLIYTLTNGSHVCENKVVAGPLGSVYCIFLPEATSLIISSWQMGFPFGPSRT